MSQVKLFSSTGGARVAKRSGKPKKKKVKKPLKTLAIWLLVILCLEALYFFCVYTNNSFVKKWRTIYINTAMDTMRHQWLATYFIPKDVIDEVRYEYGLFKAATVGKESNANWGKTDSPAEPDSSANGSGNVTHIDPNVTHESDTKEDDTLTPEELEKQAQENFYSVFWELDRTSMEAYLAEHPDTLANGWDQIYINEAGFDDEGTSIQSIFGEQVLAIDAKDGVLLLRISGKGYRGVLAVGKDPSLLSIEMASTLGTAGQLSGTIAEAHNGVLAMNANGFLDPNGAGNGGLLAGYTMSNGTAYGDHFSAYAYKRIELHEDNLFYIKDALSSVSEDCTDAAEFTPALIVDGKKIMDDYWTGEQPRACIGQSENYEILMLVIEGRYPLEGILGTSVNNCSEILLQHKCMQAINLDGGSSAMLWFDGEYVTQSSSSPLRYTGGRPLPNAWVYKKRNKCFAALGACRGLRCFVRAYARISFKRSAVLKISCSVLNAERLNRTVPVSSVPADSCASGAQCSPARTQTPFTASRAASVSQSICAAHRLSVPLCGSPVNSCTPGTSVNRDVSSFLWRTSCASRRCGVCCCTKCSPAARPQIPQTFCVPASA